jgi:hypothetical protein
MAQLSPVVKNANTSDQDIATIKNTIGGLIANTTELDFYVYMTSLVTVIGSLLGSGTASLDTYITNNTTYHDNAQTAKSNIQSYSNITSFNTEFDNLIAGI